ncbi:uncharacterized protein LOC121372058 isoform X2 [Gigantopelta aegis]|uniref:uncharacterized protein LOC121372058 isoform X2 n=1 Tax=Gigantopelta aegis TaxID=1735272 RepID=UPI001B888353|nr:uncharacterized protein LOC121372058 isoform X2 [Gigantopelta aegis]
MMVSVRQSDGVQLSAFAVNGHFIHLYKNRTRELIIKCLGSVTDFTMSCSRGAWELWVATSSNHVYRVAETNVRNDTHSKLQSARDSALVSNQEIFDDLLDNNTVHPFCETLHEASEAYIVLDERFCILHKDSIILCIAAMDGHMWCLEHKDDDFSICDHQVTSSKQLETNMHVSPNMRYHLNVQRKYLDDQITKCSLYLAISQTYAEYHDVSSCSVILSTRTFSVLFGMEAALVNAPVLLVSTPDGCIYFRQLTEHQSLLSGDWQILCETGNSVSFIGSIILEKADSENTDVLFPPICQHDELASDAIIACCDMGKVVITAEDPTGHVSYETLVVQGLTSSWSCHGKQLFHSSTVSVFTSTINRKSGRRDDKTWTNLFNIKTEPIHDISVSHMVHIYDPLKHDESLLCYTRNGDTVVLETRPRGLSQRSRGLNIKELLLGLDYNSKRQECIQNQQDHLNMVLQQINMASELASEMNHTSRLIKSQCRVESLKNGYSREHHLSVSLTNQSSFTLSPDWNLHILFTLNDKLETKTESHDFILSSGLKGKSDFQVTIPLSEPFTLSARFTVTVFLVLNLCKNSLTVSSTTPPSLPLFLESHSIDALFYIEDGPGCSSGCVCRDDILRRLADDRRPACSTHPGCFETNTVYSADVFIPVASLPTDLMMFHPS